MHGWRHVPDDDSQKGKVMISNIYNPDHDRVVSGKEIFGHDWNRFAAVCDKVFHHSLDPHGDLDNPAVDRLIREYGGIGGYQEKTRRPYSVWFVEYPDRYPAEWAQYCAQKAEQDAEYAREFRILYGIAQRHHIRVVWNASYPDRFDLYRYGNRIGYVSC